MALGSMSPAALPVDRDFRDTTPGGSDKAISPVA